MITGYRDTDEIVLAFCDVPRPYPFDWLIKKGFRHIVMYVHQDGLWIELDPMRHKLKARIVDYEAWWLHENVTVVRHLYVTEDISRRATIGLWTCTSQAKALLGIDKSVIITPYQLFRFLSCQK